MKRHGPSKRGAFGWRTTASCRRKNIDSGSRLQMRTRFGTRPASAWPSRFCLLSGAPGGSLRHSISVLLLALIVGSVHFISTQKLQRQLALLRQQEAVEKERARIARDLHDQLGANLTQVALLGEMAENDKHLPDEVESHAEQIAATAGTPLVRWMKSFGPSTLPMTPWTASSIISASMPRNFSLSPTCGIASKSPPQLPSVPISPELRHNAFLAAKEAVNNVVKHSGASSAWLRLQFSSLPVSSSKSPTTARACLPTLKAKGATGCATCANVWRRWGVSLSSLLGKRWHAELRLRHRSGEKPSTPS